MNIIDGNGASEVLRLSALHTNKVVKTQTQKKPPLSDSICIRCGAKAGLKTQYNQLIQKDLILQTQKYAPFCAPRHFVAIVWITS